MRKLTVITSQKPQPIQFGNSLIAKISRSLTAATVLVMKYKNEIIEHYSHVIPLDMAHHSRFHHHRFHSDQCRHISNPDEYNIRCCTCSRPDKERANEVVSEVFSHPSKTPVMIMRKEPHDIL